MYAGESSRGGSEKRSSSKRKYLRNGFKGDIEERGRSTNHSISLLIQSVSHSSMIQQCSLAISCTFAIQ